MQLQPHKHKYIITAYNCGARQQIALYTVCEKLAQNLLQICYLAIFAIC